MVRISKQSERRAQSPKRPRIPVKPGTVKKTQPVQAFKEHANALEGAAAKQAFIPKIH